MNNIDYGTFLRPNPPRRAGVLLDTFQAIAKARQQREELQMQLDQRREAERIGAEGRSAALAEAARASRAREANATRGLDETERSHRAGEENAAAGLEQRKQEAMSKLMADKEFRAALGSGDPNALSQWLPMMQANGITLADVMDPGTGWQEGDQPAAQPQGIEPPPLTSGQGEGAPILDADEGVDAISGPAPVAQAPTPTGRKSITGPGGLSFMFDPATNALSRTKAAQRAEAMANEAAAGADRFQGYGLKGAGKSARLAIELGADPVDIGKGIGASSTALAGQESSRRNADVAGARGEARATLGEERVELSKGNYARALAKDILGQFGFKEVQAGNRKFNDMAAQLSSTPNAAMDAVAAGNFVKMAQGGTGVISDSDMRVFWERIGGLEMKAEAAIQGLIDGTLPDDKRAAVLQAVKELAKQANNNMNLIRGRLRDGMSSDPNVTPEMRASVLKTYQAEAQTQPGGADRQDALLNALEKLKAMKGGPPK